MRRWCAAWTLVVQLGAGGDEVRAHCVGQRGIESCDFFRKGRRNWRLDVGYCPLSAEEEYYV